MDCCSRSKDTLESSQCLFAFVRLSSNPPLRPIIFRQRIERSLHPNKQQTPELTSHGGNLGFKRWQMLPQTQIAGHLVIERDGNSATAAIWRQDQEQDSLCQATVLATQIWLKLDSENLNRSLLFTFGWSETQILSGRREPAGPYGSGEVRVSCEDKRGDRCGFTMLHRVPTKVPLLVVRILRLWQTSSEKWHTPMLIELWEEDLVTLICNGSDL